MANGEIKNFFLDLSNDEYGKNNNQGEKRFSENENPRELCSAVNRQYDECGIKMYNFS